MSKPKMSIRSNIAQLALPTKDVMSAKQSLRRIRNFLAGQVVGVTRDEALLDEVLKCAYCKIFLERQIHTGGNPEADLSFNIKSMYNWAFQQICEKFPTLFKPTDIINLSSEAVYFIDSEFSAIDLLETTHDIIGDIYETFLGSAYRGQEGQFFTPKTAVNALVEMTQPKAHELIVDPACGSGSFLLEAARYIGKSSAVIPDNICGVDKDGDLARLAQMHLAIQYDSLFPIHNADSLRWGGNGFDNSTVQTRQGCFDLVLTNPPFGAKIVALTNETRSQFKLAYRWKFNKKLARWEPQNDFSSNTPPQVLFVERCLSLLKEGGRLGIVIPESTVSSPNHRYVMQYVLDIATPIAVIGMPESLFKTSGKGGTHTKVCLVVLRKGKPSPDDKVFMAEAKWCGHDSRGKTVPKNDIPQIIENYKAFKENRLTKQGSLGYVLAVADIRDLVLAPRFYNPETLEILQGLAKTHDLIKIEDLVKHGAVSITTGDEIGKLAYGSGEIPFVRTSDISSWEIKVDPKHLVSRDVYEQFALKQDVREGDILMVRDGTYLIGQCAFVTRLDKEILYQSHILKIRVHETAPFDNYFLLAALSSQPVL